MLVIKALVTKDVGLAPFGLLIQDAYRCTLAFSLLSYSHTKREGNQVAHNLAKLAITIPNWPRFLNKRSQHSYKKKKKRRSKNDTKSIMSFETSVTIQNQS